MTWIKVSPNKWIAVSGPKRDKEFTFDPSKVCNLRYDVLSIINEFLDWAPTPSAMCIKNLKRDDYNIDDDSEDESDDKKVSKAYRWVQGGWIVWPCGPNMSEFDFNIDVLNYLDALWSRPRLRTMDFGEHPVAELIEKKWLDDATYLMINKIYEEGEFDWERVPWPISRWIRHNNEKAWEIGLT